MRPYRCTYCPKDFTNFPNWLKHTRRRHKVDHKTGEKLVVMPNFLNKPNKANKAGKLKTTKKATKAVAGGGSSSICNNNNNNNNDNNSSQHGINTINSIKVEATEVITISTPAQHDEVCDGSGATIARDGNRSEHDANDEQKDNAMELVDKCAMPFVVTGSDLSTITVNNRTLPLNTSDDLERAAALLMHQTLDLEDDLEFFNIKSELIDPMEAVGDDGQSFGKASQQPHSNGLPPDFPNFHGPDFLYYSYYPQATQCDFAMMPLPPINTVKRKLKGISSSSTIFPGMTNVL